MKIKITLIALLTCFTFYAQNFREIQLPTPNQVNPLFIGPVAKSAIHYGVTPPNYNGKVIIFNHGYIDLNQSQFLFNNTFYKETYNEGYQVAFVATTRGGGIWKNGKLLAESIDIITNKFNVNNADLIVHSNGGKAAEAAMIQYGAKNKVKKVFALGTPFWGTYLADISQMPFLRWAWSLTGLNEGANTSTTYYCKYTVRPYLDKNPNNEPEKFVVLGASGFYNGSNLLVRAGFITTGGILLPAEGVNDGVASYKSTLRPNATYIFRKNDPRAIFDHIDVSRGQFSWAYIKPYIENRTVTNTIKSTDTNPNLTEKDIIESNYYILHSENKYDRIILDKNSNYAVVEILHKKPKANFIVKDQFGKQLNNIKKHSSQDNKTSIVITSNNNTIASDSKFAAFVKQNNGVTMALEQKTINNHQILKVDFTHQKKEIISLINTDVRAIITRTSHINGAAIEEEPKIISFELKNNSFFFDTKNMEDGVYSMLITGENNLNFKRNIISGFVVGDINKGLAAIQTNNILEETEKAIHISPNSVHDYAQLTLEGYAITDYLSIEVYDITGKEIKKFKLKTKQNTQIDISNHIKSLSSGLYILKVNTDQTLKFIKE